MRSGRGIHVGCGCIRFGGQIAQDKRHGNTRVLDARFAAKDLRVAHNVFTPIILGLCHRIERGESFGGHSDDGQLNLNRSKQSDRGKPLRLTRVPV